MLCPNFLSLTFVWCLQTRKKRMEEQNLLSYAALVGLNKLSVGTKKLLNFTDCNA